MYMKRLLILGISLTALSAFNPAEASSIGFDTQVPAGPDKFNDVVVSPQTLNINQDDNATALSGTVVFEGGVILTSPFSVPAADVFTSVYGTAELPESNAGQAINKGLLNPITITFNLANPIKNFSVDVLNGLTEDGVPVDGNPDVAWYRVADNAGHTDEFTLVPVNSSGKKTVAFPVSGNIVTITGITGPGGVPTAQWDFLIDHVQFEEVSVPDTGSTLAMLAGGVALLPLLRRRSVRA
jgi:hypothetical protein